MLKRLFTKEKIDTFIFVKIEHVYQKTPKENKNMPLTEKEFASLETKITQYPEFIKNYYKYGKDILIGKIGRNVQTFQKRGNVDGQHMCAQKLRDS